METDGSSPMYPMAPDYISKCVNSLKRATNVFFFFFCFFLIYFLLSFCFSLLLNKNQSIMDCFDEKLSTLVQLPKASYFIHLFWKFKTLTEIAKTQKKRMLNPRSTATVIPSIPAPKPKRTLMNSLTVPSNPGPTILDSTSPSWEVIMPRKVHAIGQI